jgi:hypothetical protein
MTVAVYANDSRGRSLAMLHISKLVENGYERTDVAGEKVVLKKITKQGKICSTTHIVEVKHVPATKQIEIVESETISGVSKAKRVLYGFASPSVECANAVRAGLFNEFDYDIMRGEYNSHDWCYAGN